MSEHTEAQPLELELMADDSKAGFRLQRLEILNWGTFNGRPWILNLDGSNALLTGDNGSGKSTLVDAVTTLLVPSNQVAFNKAAGAENRERTLRTYVLGHYKAERGDGVSSSKPVALRDQRSYSVILGVFTNAAYGQTITLAQVFWLRNPTDSPSRFYVCSEEELSIAEHFTGFGAEMPALRKRLRSQNAELSDTFPSYGAWYRRRFGIQSEQAMELFHQTVSMKSVGNLTDFVRQHMLKRFDVESRLTALVDHFEDLDQAHAAVLRAKDQISLLRPLADNLERHESHRSELGGLRASRDAIHSYMGHLQLDLLDTSLAQLDERHAKLSAKVDEHKARRAAIVAETNDVRRSIADNGGGRLEWLAAQIAEQGRERDKRRKRADRFANLLATIETPLPSDGDAFVGLRTGLDTQQASLETEEDDLQNARTELAVQMATKRAEHKALSAEIDDLARRRNNIPLAQVRLRTKLAEATGLEPSAVPFVGELLQVRPEEARWEGAAERLLHTFALSLLVADDSYDEVAAWVDRTHLKGRVVYFRVRSKDEHATNLDTLDPASLFAKVDIKTDTPFYSWVERELARRFDHICCEDQERFRRERFAITTAGQVKSAGRRHEKDDRYRIDDRSRYVLGWSNEAKLAALEADRERLEATIAELANRLSGIDAELRTLRDRGQALSALAEYRSFEDIDWATVAASIADYETERKALQASSDVLRNLNEQLHALELESGNVEQRLGEAQGERAKVEQRQADRQESREVILAATKEPAYERHREWFAALDRYRAEAFTDTAVTLKNADRMSRELREWVQDAYDKVDKRIARVAEQIARQMTTYQNRYPLETQEVDASIEAGSEYVAMLAGLESDGLPAFEAKFKEQLNTNTIREVASFQSQLNKERDTIRERVAQINESLTKIDYNPGRYIALVAERSSDQEVAQFQTDLRACTEGSLTGSDDDQYSEAKFLQVKAIIERFRGREGLADADRRWTNKVTDVRNWFGFSASERWQEDDAEHEHYSDSSGKSGGQKEKLAYTVLAASLAYQFGLEWGQAKSRTFRFVVIDEAFGRGDDGAARYGLRLFSQLNLQLLVVTPLKHIHIIEPFVANVGFVFNEAGMDSKVRNLTIAEHQAEQAARAASSASAR